MILEDDSGEYFCDICEEERNANQCVYYCVTCKFIAHIHCVFNNIIKRWEASSVAETSINRESKALVEMLPEQEQEQQSDIEIPPDPQIRHSFHRHPLNLYEVTENFGISRYCRACDLKILGPGYGCNKQSCKHYHLHKACGELPHEIVSHPLHLQHPLTLFTRFPQDMSGTGLFVCDECGDISHAYLYFCSICNFKLDLKCAAALTAPRNIEDQRLKQESNFFHFGHSSNHTLVFANIEDNFSTRLYCNGCLVTILGPAYCCLDCNFFLHQSCYFALPKEMQCPLHPLHTVQAIRIRANLMIYHNCYACGLSFTDQYNGICYGCYESGRQFLFHFFCLKSLGRALKSNFHVLRLYYFGTESQMFFNTYSGSAIFFCEKCSKGCEEPFYHCVECQINFHLECLPIPQTIKSQCHVHHLTFKASFVEDDSGEYYCDVCEEERHEKDQVYFCEECHGLFVAHIECVLNKVEGFFSFWKSENEISIQNDSEEVVEKIFMNLSETLESNEEEPSIHNDIDESSQKISVNQNDTESTENKLLIQSDTEKSIEYDSSSEECNIYWE
ncbi:hypothetical protein REPUB_Repub16aG0107500 [Reevesia pubescens]